MRVELNYGKGTVPLELSDQWSVSVIRKPAMPVLRGSACGAASGARALRWAAARSCRKRAGHAPPAS